jgi:hypothetical protein
MGIGSVGGLASQMVQAAQFNLAGQVQSSAGSSASGSGNVGGSGSSGSFSEEYAMSLLAKITHASADQALTLIKAMSTQSPTALSQGAAYGVSGPAMVDPLWGRQA